jgi:hypothetical protein
MIDQNDKLRNDPLRADALRYDPIGKDRNKDVDHYYKDWKVAMSPEERAGGENYKGQVDTAVKQQTGLLNQYRSAYGTALNAADAQASKIMGDARGQVAGAMGKIPTQQRVKFSVYSDGFGKLEHTYSINADAAANIMAEINKQDALVGGDAKNGYAINSKGYGKEIHEALIDAQRQTDAADDILRDQRSAAGEAGEIQLGALSDAISTQRGIMTTAYDNEVAQAEKQIAFTKSLWTNYLKDQQAAFTRGKETNAGGIKALIDSGALEVTGKIS